MMNLSGGTDGVEACVEAGRGAAVAAVAELSAARVAALLVLLTAAPTCPRAQPS